MMRFQKIIAVSILLAGISTISSVASPIYAQYTKSSEVSPAVEKLLREARQTKNETGFELIDQALKISAKGSADEHSAYAHQVALGVDLGRGDKIEEAFLALVDIPSAPESAKPFYMKEVIDIYVCRADYESANAMIQRLKAYNPPAVYYSFIDTAERRVCLSYSPWAKRPSMAEIDARLEKSKKLLREAEERAQRNAEANEAWLGVAEAIQTGVTQGTGLSASGPRPSYSGSTSRADDPRSVIPGEQTQTFGQLSGSGQYA
ncbi:MAG: hypothetical protein EOP04_29510, partial [Proteobacteria bacterium]